MPRVFITGSSDGLGLLSAKELIKQGHEVVLQARNKIRQEETLKKVPEVKSVLVADLSDIDATKKLADQVNQHGVFDAVIHNAGVYQVPSKMIFHVNTLAPYILTCLIQRPKRLVYLSSGMHLSGRPNLENFKLDATDISYSDSKLHVVMLAKVVAEKWKETYSNAIDPGWVPTKMGGRGAPDDLQRGYETQVWLASSDDKKAKVSGEYFHHQKSRSCNPVANDPLLREKFLMACEDVTGIAFPT